MTRHDVARHIRVYPQHDPTLFPRYTINWIEDIDGLCHDRRLVMSNILPWQLADEIDALITLWAE